MKRAPRITASVMILCLMALGQGAAQKTELRIESWRNDDLKIWRDTILPAFEKDHPNIDVVFTPSAPAEYNAVVETKLKGGTAGDIIACRPFDASLGLYNAKHLVALNDLKGLRNFSTVAKAAWSTDDGKTTFCVPTAAVIHGFLYNKAVFKELGLSEPKTEKEFLAAMEKVKANKKYAPIAMGSKDQWEAATMGYQNIGPTLWKGEQGRTGLLKGSAQYNKGGFLQAFQALERWRPYLPQGYQALAYPDVQNLFAQGRAAVYPAGSWDIATFRGMNPKLDLGAFPAYTFAAGQKCVISDHPDIGFGLNAASKNKDAAKVFLEWMAGPEFARLYANALPGFYPLANVAYKVNDPVAQEFLDWRKTCDKTFRSSYQLLSRNANPNNENDLWNATAQVLNGKMTPQQAGDFVQKNLASWYAPQKGK
ncbi:ABC transporter substrate-binding protein [Deinococcus peraridilitoris]|uniref:Probable sugar-binding periplasmic protein n=1 Tax=Deinococcus peraridilitoris (strain DSM 19664 / LMG 22246 / CIP 109416 / KR-200) TaxID=937777 RepID=L0A288_DEIPD|nr:ABC transporter substrate-binding protein [Deinococcus peraridilitoris]AFZ68018.1 ABC-type sugar transport system, periplasmic component [Deinococcus peraridilitoris DSM 19664]